MEGTVNVVLWIIAGLLALAFLAAGAMKLIQPKEKLIASGMGWAADVSDGTVKLIGAAEVLAAVGLILPEALDIAPILTPLAAVGLVVIMIGAIVVHVRRKEAPMAAINLVLLILAAVVAGGRF
jgi:uncharacterized membrane protein YphA (DoxX/SURF4 family)